MWGCRGWGWQAAGTWVLVSVKWWDSPPALGDLEPANQYASSKSLRAPKFEQKPTPFAPVELLCKHVAREVVPIGWLYKRVTNHFVTRR